MSFLKVHVTALGTPLTFLALEPNHFYLIGFLLLLVWLFFWGLGGFCLFEGFFHDALQIQLVYLNEASKFSVAPSVPQSALGMLLTE